MNHKNPEFSFCPVCGHGLIFSRPRKNEPIRSLCPSCGFILYPDPKVVACSVPEMGNQIVLVRRGINPQKGKWVLPGGYVDRGEKVMDAAIRETEEECGLKTTIKNLLGVYSYSGDMHVVIVYVAEHVSGCPTAKDETLEAALFSENQIPWHDFAFRSTPEALQDYYLQKKDPHTSPNPSNNTGY